MRRERDVLGQVHARCRDSMIDQSVLMLHRAALHQRSLTLWYATTAWYVPRFVVLQYIQLAGSTNAAIGANVGDSAVTGWVHRRCK